MVITREMHQKYKFWYYDLLIAEYADREYFKSRKEKP